MFNFLKPEWYKTYVKWKHQNFLEVFSLIFREQKAKNGAYIWTLEEMNKLVEDLRLHWIETNQL